MNRSATASAAHPNFWSAVRVDLVYLLFALPLGFAILCANPPFQAPDEFEHLFRAFQISEGVILGERRGQQSGGELPIPVVAVANTEGIAFHPERKMTEEIFRRKLEPPFVDWSQAGRIYTHFPHTVIYPPSAYAPQAAVLALGRMVHVGPLGLLYLARISVLLCTIGLGWKALRWLPVYRWSALLLLLTPMCLYLMGSAAPDGLIFGTAFLIAAIAARRLVDTREPPQRKELVILLSCAFLLGTAKIVYFPIAIAAAALVTWRLATPRARVGFGLAFVVLCILPAVLWSRLATGVYVVGRGDIPIDAAAQSRHLLAHPFAFLGLIGRTFWMDGRGIYEFCVGTLGWGDTRLPVWFYRFFGFGLLASVMLESGCSRGLTWRQRVIFAAGVIASVGLIAVAQYVTWNAPGSQNPIECFSGRYLIPLLPFALLCIPSLHRFRLPAWIAPAAAMSIGAISGAVCLIAVIQRYYIG